MRIASEWVGVLIIQVDEEVDQIYEQIEKILEETNKDGDDEGLEQNHRKQKRWWHSERMWIRKEERKMNIVGFCKTLDLWITNT